VFLRLKRAELSRLFHDLIADFSVESLAPAGGADRAGVPGTLVKPT